MTTSVLARRPRALGFTPTRVGTTVLRIPAEPATAWDRFTPHARGDDGRPAFGPAVSLDRSIGSPPRAWGRPRSRRCPGTLWSAYGSPPRAWGRPTPAAAIGTRGVRFTPHARGDDSGVPSRRSDRHYGRGSPPRAWGRRSSRRARRRGPASSTVHSPRAWGRRVEAVSVTENVERQRFTPHARGDDVPGRSPESSPRRANGSPPRARGDDDAVARPMTARPDRAVHSPTRVGTTLKAPRSRIARIPPRFTPTRVGTTAPPRPSGARPPATVHPHARGDDSASRRCASVHGGSPPRAWGRRWTYCGGGDRVHRFTPTRVGTTLSSSGSHRDASGLISHARGGRRRWAWRPAPVTSGRFTPTRVGRRSAGVKAEIAVSRCGSSPHARVGTTRSSAPIRGCGLVERFTPTPVGTTC